MASREVTITLSRWFIFRAVLGAYPSACRARGVFPMHPLALVFLVTALWSVAFSRGES